MKKILTVAAALILCLAGCSSTRNGQPKIPEIEVPIAINVNMSGTARNSFINQDYFKLRVLDDLEDFQTVNFALVGNDESPEITLNIDVESFVIWPRDERHSRRRISRNIAVGTDASGKPVYQTVTAIVDIVQVQRRSNALFDVTLAIRGNPPLDFKRSFSPSYNYVNTYVDNVQGDQRALDASLSMARGAGFEPVEDDFLLILAKEEMLRRLSNEIRKYYNARAKNQN